MTTETLFKWVPITEDMEFEDKMNYSFLLQDNSKEKPIYESGTYRKEHDLFIYNSFEGTKREDLLNCGWFVLLPVQAISLEEHEKALKAVKESKKIPSYSMVLSLAVDWIEKLIPHLYNFIVKNTVQSEFGVVFPSEQKFIEYSNNYFLNNLKKESDKIKENEKTEI